MPEAWSSPGADAILAGTAFPTTVFVKLHTGDPGPSGTSNAATETRRIEVDLDTPSGGVVVNSTYGEILNAAATEDATHVTLWSASSGGTCFMIHELAVALEIVAGETIAIAIGQLTVTLPIWV